MVQGRPGFGSCADRRPRAKEIPGLFRRRTPPISLPLGGDAQPAPYRPTGSAGGAAVLVALELPWATASNALAGIVFSDSIRASGHALSGVLEVPGRAVVGEHESGQACMARNMVCACAAAGEREARLQAESRTHRRAGWRCGSSLPRGVLATGSCRSRSVVDLIAWST